jgi:hypothetical protein
MNAPNEPRPARGHMPFAGHRTQKEVREAQERARHGRSLAFEYGLDPECLGRDR